MATMVRRVGGILFFAFLVFSKGPVIAGPLHVVTSLPDFAAIARIVGGEHVDVSSIMRGGQDPHFVDPKPSFLRRLSQADAVVVAGLELDQWMDLLIEQARNPRIIKGQPGYVDGSAGIDLLEVRKGNIDRSMGDVHPYGNPHYWLDPRNGAVIARQLAERFARIDGDHATDYKKNADIFAARIDTRYQQWKKRFSTLKDRRIVAYHNSWPYFAKAFGLTVIDFVEPKPGITPPPAHIVELIQMMKKNGVRVIVKEPFFSNALPDKIAAESGAVVVNLTQSVGGLPGVNDYFDLFEVNTRLLAGALGGR